MSECVSLSFHRSFCVAHEENHIDWTQTLHQVWLKLWESIPITYAMTIVATFCWVCSDCYVSLLSLNKYVISIDCKTTYKWFSFLESSVQCNYHFKPRLDVIPHLLIFTTFTLIYCVNAWKLEIYSDLWRHGPLSVSENRSSIFQHWTNRNAIVSQSICWIAKNVMLLYCNHIRKRKREMNLFVRMSAYM